MKTKIQLILFSLVFGLVACSSDDDSVSLEGDIIVGEWKLEEIIVDGNKIVLQNCEDEERLIFRSDGSFRVEVYQQDSETQECEISNVFTGSWGKESELTYTTTMQGSTAPFQVNFSSDGNELIVNEQSLDQQATQQKIYERQ
ncbi:MAG: lipocalin family protein [Bacteroidota bacterium]